MQLVLLRLKLRTSLFKKNKNHCFYKMNPGSFFRGLSYPTFTTFPPSPQSTGTPSSTPSAPPLRFHSHPDSNPGVLPPLLPDNPSSMSLPAPAENVVATLYAYLWALRGSPVHPRSKQLCYSHCNPVHAPRPSLRNEGF